jgi:hypothetical protein
MEKKKKIFWVVLALIAIANCVLGEFNAVYSEKYELFVALLVAIVLVAYMFMYKKKR